MRSPLFLPLFVPLLVLIWGFSLAGLGISSALIAHYHSDFAGHLGQWTMALLATFCFASFCATAILLGLLVVPLIAGSFLLNAIIWGLVWIMALVEASGLVVALSNNSCSRIRCNAFGRRCVRVRCGLFHSQEGVAWVVCWLSFFLLIVIIWSWVTRESEEEAPRPVEPVPPGQREGAVTAEPEQPQMAQKATAAV